jgi:hypothetical protein
LQNTIDGDADDPEREQKQPHKGIHHKCEQCQRPAEHKENAPKNESEHGSSSASGYDATKQEVPEIRRRAERRWKAGGVSPVLEMQKPLQTAERLRSMNLDHR